MKFILGLKIGMSQVFDEKGNQVPVTLIKIDPCKVLQIKTKEKDGYRAVQIGFIPKKKNIKKTEKGKEFRHIKEYRIREENETLSDMKIGDEISAAIFNEGDAIKVSGISKGRGFTGAVKKWGFKGKLSSTHGTKHENRTLGSVGSSFPQRVTPGRKMPGRMGFERVTIKNVKIVKVDKDNNLLAVRGAVPGRNGTLLEIKG